MYKGSTTFDSFDDADVEQEELLRVSKEFQDPEDSPKEVMKF